MPEKHYAVYILASKRNGMVYIGATSNLPQRIWQHKQKAVSGFTQKYNVDQLVYYELHASLNDALLREKQLKEWKRDWKLRLIEASNPEWLDLYYTMCGVEG